MRPFMDLESPLRDLEPPPSRDLAPLPQGSPAAPSGILNRFFQVEQPTASRCREHFSCVSPAGPRLRRPCRPIGAPTRAVTGHGIGSPGAGGMWSGNLPSLRHKEGAKGSMPLPRPQARGVARGLVAVPRPQARGVARGLVAVPRPQARGVARGLVTGPGTPRLSWL